LPLEPFTLGYFLGQHHHAADAVVLQTPGADLPADDVRRPVGASEDLFRTAFSGALEDALMLCLPVVRDIGKHFVVATSDQRLVRKIVVVQPAVGIAMYRMSLSNLATAAGTCLMKTSSVECVRFS
jgi:hypothetical protein